MILASMTKPWDTYETIIKELYAKHTLAAVRQIMQDEYNFSASVRAYRQKLDAWGCGKYKKREKQSRSSPSDVPSSEMAKEPSRSFSETYQQQDQAFPSQPSFQTADTICPTPEGSSLVLNDTQDFEIDGHQPQDMTSSGYDRETTMVHENFCHVVNADGYWGPDGRWYTYQSGHYVLDSALQTEYSTQIPGSAQVPAYTQRAYEP